MYIMYTDNMALLTSGECLVANSVVKLGPKNNRKENLYHENLPVFASICIHAYNVCKCA